jgi:hypothetical protein
MIAGGNKEIAGITKLVTGGLVFVHWSTQGDLNTITTQIKDALITIGKQPGTHK